MKNYEELRNKLKEKLANITEEALALELAALGMEFENPPEKVAMLIALMKARRLITDPAKWTQNVSARDKNGNYVLPINENAVCFCAGGAISKVAGNEMAKNCLEFFRSNGGALTSINDEEGHEAVLAAMDAAINQLKNNE